MYSSLQAFNPGRCRLPPGARYPWAEEGAPSSSGGGISAGISQPRHSDLASTVFQTCLTFAVHPIFSHFWDGEMGGKAAAELRTKLI